jgi:hypothetical protein
MLYYLFFENNALDEIKWVFEQLSLLPSQGVEYLYVKENKTLPPYVVFKSKFRGEEENYKIIELQLDQIIHKRTIQITYEIITPEHGDLNKL